MSDWAAKVSEGKIDLRLCPRELQVLDRLLRAVRSASYVLHNEARVKAGNDYQWRVADRWSIAQAVAQIYLELGPALFDITTTWFDGKTPTSDSDGRFSYFTNYLLNGQVFHGSVLYDVTEGDR